MLSSLGAAPRLVAAACRIQGLGENASATMIVVTPEFIDEVMRTGALAQALERSRLGTAGPRNAANWSKFSTWQLICEEILDTEHEPHWLDDIVAELGRRGFSVSQIQGMQRFAWRTAGWLNYDLMVWDWCNLDASDIRRALQRQLEMGIVSEREYESSLQLVEHPELCAE
jgi:hypothetical protein